MSWVFLESIKLWDVAVTVFCKYNKIQVLVLNLSGDSGPTDGTVKEYHSKQPPMAPGRVLWMGQEKGGGMRHTP